MDLSHARFYAILDTGYVPRSRWSKVCRALIDGGADIIQMRAKTERASERRALLAEILPLFDETRSATPPLVINDDIELALSHPGLGLHVGQDDMPATEARRLLGPDRILGLSTHSEEQAAAAIALGSGALSYFAVGPVFATQTKPGYRAVGLELVAHVAATEPGIPFFCIGGINRGNVAQVVAAGARRVVAVSDILCDPDPAAAVREMRALLPP
ncbi:MAG TPA: thiamine phosphate synthase [Opitutaceae bacterium]|nr:thiamine phosphate synthase [Opitutaceae bacterium]